ncbi:Hamartin protein-domain-containing protein [Halteromyces radiatus]|uniref:Hamartin protein-domain-containing protein n=1 Tax=Halteromyces radiatus TaxID=101107 RepID=UPI002220E637|nr:Hamartin protein-domain-containing protein [Halteromyces radiatus]KAI8083147.1 Hamartin protein-domain-containing protein [Halteromyces radiatus]
MVTLKDILRSATQTIRQATAKSTGQSTLDIIDNYLDEHPSELVTNATINGNSSNVPTLNSTPSSLLVAAATTTNLASNTSTTGVSASSNTTSSGSNNSIAPSSSTGNLEDNETHTAIDKLSSELFFLYNTTILSSPLAVTVVSCTAEAQRLHNQQYLLLCFIHALLPLLGPSRIFQTSWWSKALQPILTTAAYTDHIKQQARQIVITSLILEQQIIRQLGQYNPTSSILKPKYATWTVDYYLEWAREYQDREQHQLDALVDKQEQQREETPLTEKAKDDIRLQHQALLDMEQEEWSKNLMLILMSLGAAETKPFFCLLDGYFQSSQHRLQIVYLLSEFMLRKRSHAHEILETPLFQSMLKSLMYDNSTTLIAISVTNLIMLLPRICSFLPPYLPQLFYIFARAISWDQLRDMRKKQHSLTASSPSTKQKTDWDCADYTFSKLAAPPSNPQTGPFFTALYGLYPCNFLNFLHKPYAYFKKNGFTVPEEFDEETFRVRTMVQVSRHMLHPNLVTMDLETELTDRSRWMKMEPPDVIARIMSLDLTNAASRVAFFANNADNDDDQSRPRHTNSMDLLDTSLWSATSTTSKGRQEDEEKETENVHPPTSICSPGHQVLSPPSTNKGTSDTLDSSTKQPMIFNILQLHRALKSGAEVLIGDDIWEASLEHITSPASSSCTSPNLKDAPTSLMDHQLNAAIGDSSSETRLLIAALKREVLLLRNELNFELFLKQQHLQHIGRLHREHVMDSTVEAERQQLYNTNRMLKAQLAQTTASLEKLKSESALARQKHIKWEDEQSNKLRGYREARKEWQAHMDVANTQLDDYRHIIAEQREQLEESRKRTFELENELQTLQPDLEKASEYQHRVRQLTQQMLLWEEDTAHLKEQKRYIKGLLSQWWSMEELIASLQAENQKLMASQSQGEKELEKLTKQVSELSSSTIDKQQSLSPSALFTTFKDTQQAEMDEMKKVVQELKQQLTLSEMDKIKYQAELEQYKAQVDSDPQQSVESE